MHLIRREWQLMAGAKGEFLLPLCVYTFMLSLMIYAMADHRTVDAVASFAWLLMVFMSCFWIPGRLQKDHDNRTIHMLWHSGHMDVYIISKALVLWVGLYLPVCMVTVLMSGLLYGWTAANGFLLVNLLLGTLVILPLSLMGSCFVIGARAAGVLSSLLILPLMVPPLLIGLSFFTQFGDSSFAFTPFLLQLGYIFLTLPLFYWGATLSLEHHVQW